MCWMNYMRSSKEALLLLENARKTLPRYFIFQTLETSRGGTEIGGGEEVDIQGSANPQTPGSENKGIKSCVLLPAAGRRTQLFILLFSESGVCGFAHPCKSFHFNYYPTGVLGMKQDGTHLMDLRRSC